MPCHNLVSRLKIPINCAGKYAATMGRSRARTEINALGHRLANTNTGNGDFTPRSSAEMHKLADNVPVGTATSRLSEHVSTGVRHSRGVDQRVRVKFFV